MKQKTIRKATNQPGIYKNLNTGKYDVKHNYTSIDPLTGAKIYEQEKFNSDFEDLKAID